MRANPGATTKIAVVIGQLGLGGSERQLYIFLEHCDRDRWEPTVYVSGTLGPWRDQIRELGISVVLMRANPVMKMWQFRQSCKANSVQRFFSWSAYTNGYGLALLGLGVPCIGSLRNIFPSRSFGRYERLLSWTDLAGISTVVCNSQETAAKVRQRVGDRKRVVYIPNSVPSMENAAYFRMKWRQRLEISENEVLILGVGRLAPQKNFARFIDTAIQVHQTVPIRAVVAGRDDGCLKSLQQQIQDSGLESGAIRFIGPVPEAKELICAADLFLLSSDYEGMPNVVMEAMAAGVPCVCTNVNGIKSLIEHGVNGFITERRADALADRVLLLARDKKLREEMGASAAERMKGSFDPKMIAERLWQLCEKSVDQRVVVA